MKDSINIKKEGGSPYHNGTNYNFEVTLPWNVSDDDLKVIRDYLQKAILLISKYLSKDENEK